jgi:hypothetical protein
MKELTLCCFFLEVFGVGGFFLSLRFPLKPTLSSKSIIAFAIVLSGCCIGIILVAILR